MGQGLLLARGEAAIQEVTASPHPPFYHGLCWAGHLGLIREWAFRPALLLVVPAPWAWRGDGQGPEGRPEAVTHVYPGCAQGDQ